MCKFIDHTVAQEKKDAFAFEMAQGLSVGKAAAAIGISERSGFMWLAIDPALRERIAQFQGVLFSTALNKLARLGGKAADALEQILDDPLTSPKLRFETALAILEQGSKLRERITLDERLTKLENRASEVVGLEKAAEFEGVGSV